MNIECLKTSPFYYNKNLSDLSIPKSLLMMIDNEIANAKSILPISFDGHTLSVATYNLSNLLDKGLLLSLLQKSNPGIQDLKVYLAENNNYRNAFEKFYDIKMSQIEDFNDDGDSFIPSSEQAALVDKIFEQAISMNASDIHIIPRTNDSLVQFRVHGKMISINNLIIKKADKNFVVNVIKSRCNPPMDIGNRNIPLDGALSRSGMDFRVSTVPAVFGEKVVIRIFDSEGELKTLDSIRFSAADVNLLKKLCKLPLGMIIMTGPTGSGKTTTLYACLREIDPYEKSVFSLENPVEQKISGICQVSIREVENNPKANLDWAVGMKAGLRQDPDVILLGEIRDEATALSAVQASQSGHLLFTTLHTNGAIESVERMINFRIPRRAFLSQVSCILAQRLVEELCPDCKTNYKLSQSDIFALRKKDLNRLKNHQLYYSPGCYKCNNTGTIGRIPIVEFIVFNNIIRDFFSIEHGLVESEKFLRSAKSKSQFRSLWDKGLDLVLDGQISLASLMSKIVIDEEVDVDDESTS